MTRSMFRLATVSLFVGALALSGCSSDDAGVLGAADDDVSGAQTLETLDLDQSYGGLAYTDEPAAFGDVDLRAIEDAAALELAESEVDSMEDRDPMFGSPMMRHTYLRVLWGQLDGDFDPEADPTAFERLDWSGSVHVSDGAVALVRTILFERPYDHRLPRTSRDTLGWVSHTGPHFDGVLVKIMSPVREGVAQGTVTFETPLYTTTLDVSALDDYEQIVDVDELGNAVSLQGQVVDPSRCGAGFVNGFWRHGEDRPQTPATEMGLFRARIMLQNGFGFGYAMGGFGVNSQGERVMVGKFIAANGRIMGLIAGTWEPVAEDGEAGSFQARWVDRNGRVMGTLLGRYRAHESEGRGDGFLEGRWQEACTGGA